MEDIASAFKKMAIINPERRRVKVEQAVAEEAPEQAPITTVQPAEGFGVRAVQSQKQQVLYDGLLDRTIEERKKKKSKKTVVDENQLSIFDFVA